LIDFDPEMDSNKKDLKTGCCKRCSNRNVHRAIAQDNIFLFNRCIFGKQQIQSLNAFWSPDKLETPLDMILKGSKLNFLEALIKPKIAKSKDAQSYEQQRT